ncbi:MAG: hypothetical protein DSY55_04810 [Clostridia bacterium]|nr:MAG: hypothetical protein DSY55_04810 [Clostridia bacterium]
MITKMKTHKRWYLLLLALLLVLLSGCSEQTSTPEVWAMTEPVATSAFQSYATVLPTPTFTPPATPTPFSTPTLIILPTATPTRIVVQVSRPAASPQVTATSTSTTLVTTEEEANEVAQTALSQQQDVTIEDVQVDFRPDEMILSGYTTMGFFRIKVALYVMVTPIDGSPEVTITDIYVNDKPATGFIRTQIESMIEPHLAELAVVSDTFYVENVSINDDEMIIMGHYR